MAISEYTDFEQLARYAGSLPDGTDVEHTLPPYCVIPPLGDVVAELQRQLARVSGCVASDGTDIAVMKGHIEALSNRIAYLERRDDTMGEYIRTLQGQVAHLSRLLHKAINHGCVDNYGDEVDGA